MYLHIKRKRLFTAGMALLKNEFNLVYVEIKYIYVDIKHIYVQIKQSQI